MLAPTKPRNANTKRDPLRRFTPRQRQRILDRLRSVAELERLVRERPYAGRWSA